ncbi:MAG: hypothetical protein ACUVXI_16300 [bacterium]
MVINIPEVPGAKVPKPNERALKVLMSPEIGNSEDATILVSIISPGSTTGSHIFKFCVYIPPLPPAGFFEKAIQVAKSAVKM